MSLQGSGRVGVRALGDLGVGCRGLGFRGCRGGV